MSVMQNDIKKAVEDLGIQRGDVVLVHSSFKSMGYVEGSAEAVVAGFLDAIGEEGTLVFPTFCQKDFAHAYETWHLDKQSDVGYRLYDYRRRDKSGNLRELHVEKGVKASNCKKMDVSSPSYCSDGIRLLGSCEYFSVKEITLLGKRTFCADEKSYQALVVIEGEAELIVEDHVQKMWSGETVFIPANM